MRYAECLQAEGVHEGDVVGLCSENRIDFPCAMFGAIYLGATVAPLNLTYLESESSRVELNGQTDIDIILLWPIRSNTGLSTEQAAIR